MGRRGIIAAMLVALALVTFGVVAAVRADRPSKTAEVETPQLVSMEETGRTMQQAATAMQGHAQAMRDEGRRTSNQDLVGHGDHWLGDAAELDRAVRSMLQDPSKARQVDIEALRWNGLSMRSEGQNMVDHARVMAEELDLMIERHGLRAQAATDLRAGTEALRLAGEHLKQNGQAMADYADQLRRGMGLK